MASVSPAKKRIEAGEKPPFSPRSKTAAAAAAVLSTKKMPKTKDPRILGPRILGNKPNVDNFILYMARQEPVDADETDEKVVNKTMRVQSNKKYFVSTLLKTLITPGIFYFFIIMQSFNLSTLQKL